MIRSMAIVAGLTAAAFVSTGCSVGGAASTGFSMFKNSKANALELDIWLDGQTAKRNKMKQAATGHSRYKIATPISTNPSFKYTPVDAEQTGRISGTHLAIYKARGSDMSDQAEYRISPTGTGAAAQFQAGQTYNLSNPGPGFRITNWEGQTVSSVQLEPNTDYVFQFVASADDSATAQIWFSTN